MIISPVFFLDDVAQGMYDTDRCIDIASAYGFDVYANIIEKSHQKQHLYEDTLFDAV